MCLGDGNTKTYPSNIYPVDLCLPEFVHVGVCKLNRVHMPCIGHFVTVPICFCIVCVGVNYGVSVGVSVNVFTFRYISFEFKPLVC